jgi:hypothetical protein
LDAKAILVPGSPEWWLNHLCQKFTERDHTFDLQDPVIDGGWRQPVYFRTRRSG